MGNISSACMGEKWKRKKHRVFSDSKRVGDNNSFQFSQFSNDSLFLFCSELLFVSNAVRIKLSFSSSLSKARCRKSFCIVSSSLLFKKILFCLLCNNAAMEQVVREPQIVARIRESPNVMFKNRNKHNDAKEARKKVKIRSEIKAVFRMRKFFPFFGCFKLEKMKKIYYNRRKKMGGVTA